MIGAEIAPAIKAAAAIHPARRMVVRHGTPRTATAKGTNTIRYAGFAFAAMMPETRPNPPAQRLALE
jgi:hypothetical protein